MKERPILFSAPMVRAILDGRKTQTRRIMKHQPGKITNTGRPIFFEWFDHGRRVLPKCPYGKPGDRLWVRETHYLVRAQGKPDGQVIEIDYKADPSHTIRMCPQKWRPSIHMPRWASRILLEIVSLRVELLNDISEADAKAEGVLQVESDGYQNYDGTGGYWGSAINSFETLWESINGSGSWQANPWVWVVEFKVVEPKSC